MHELFSIRLQTWKPVLNFQVKLLEDHQVKQCVKIAAYLLHLMWGRFCILNHTIPQKHIIKENPWCLIHFYWHVTKEAATYFLHYCMSCHASSCSRPHHSRCESTSTNMFLLVNPFQSSNRRKKNMNQIFCRTFWIFLHSYRWAVSEIGASSKWSPKQSQHMHKIHILLL